MNVTVKKLEDYIISRLVEIEEIKEFNYHSYLSRQRELYLLAYMMIGLDEDEIERRKKDTIFENEGQA